jgi:hypothetical protein
MKKILIVFLALMSLSVIASKDFQMKNILGDWHIEGEAVLRIYKQSNNSVKMFWCDEIEFLSSSKNHCSYSFMKIYQYRSDLDSFFSPRGKYCSESLQVSIQYPTDLVRFINPYLVGGCNSSGTISEASKLD